MPQKTIQVDISPNGIDSAIKVLRDWRKETEAKINTFLEALARTGTTLASVNYSMAEYDGSNDVQCHWEQIGDKEFAVVATGDTVLFIEFGTGISFPNDHPEVGSFGFQHGTYGWGRGANKNGWTYLGEPGTNGKVLRDGIHVHTYGNPSNACLYNAKKELLSKIEEIARRVFT